GPAKDLSGDHIDGKTAPYTSKDIRFTTKDGALYAILLALPTGSIQITSLAKGLPQDDVESVSLVGSNERIQWTQDSHGLNIAPIKKFPTSYAAVFNIKLRENYDPAQAVEKSK
ncbi:MAG: alpha-L-fucosidase C-terminal domain-containing protein, partial [Candidatus Micrarchaeaceae archaeon]